MILINLKGGIGNQMFQYAYSRALALRSGQELSLDISSYTTQAKLETLRETPRSFKIDNYNIHASPASPTSEEVTRIKYPLGILSKLQQLFSKKILRRFNIAFNPTTFKKNNARATSGHDVYLDGFWWSEEYFKDASEIIRTDFTLKNPLGTQAQKIAHVINTADSQAGHISISLHVRRGDYVKDARTNAYHGLCSKEYYDAALNEITKRLGHTNIHLFIFSDDITWVEQNMLFPYPTTHVSQSGIEDYEEIHLMSMCEHHIIANSSFSWWGAWLNPRPNKIVIAPLHWTAKKVRDSKAMIPESWIRI